MEQMMRWNLNNKMTVELTEHGARIYNQAMLQQPSHAQVFITAKSGDQVTMQAAKAIEMFGPTLTSCLKQPISFWVLIEPDPIAGRPLAMPVFDAATGNDKTPVQVIDEQRAELAQLRDRLKRAESPGALNMVPIGEFALLQRIKDLAEECVLANDIVAAMAETARPTLELMPSIMRYNVLIGKRARAAGTQARPERPDPIKAGGETHG